MRSRLEADYAADLDRRENGWEYEPECFASTDGQWLPDFLVRSGGMEMYTEVKPAGPLMQLEDKSLDYFNHVDDILKRMTIAWESKPDAFLHLVFWKYGGPFYLTLFSVCRDSPWYALNGGPVELLWPGMEQYQRVGRQQPGDTARTLSCNIGPGHWQCSCGCDVQRDGFIGPLDVCAHLRALGDTQKDAKVFRPLNADWPSFVGPEAAVHTWPDLLRGDTFTIFATSEEWAAKMRRCEERLIRALNVLFDPDPVSRIDVRIAAAGTESR